MQGFNKKFIDDFKVLTTANVGLEFEWFSNDSYFKTLEKLNVYFGDTDKVIWGFNNYHSDFVPTDKEFKIEPDFSGGANMIELITGPMSYIEAKLVMIKMFEFIKLNGYTDNHSSIHINISFNDMDHKIENLNPLKLILSINEEVIYEKFPSRRNNIYCQSIEFMIPFSDYPDPETGINQIISNLLLPTDTKYYGVNLQKRTKGWLEWRYIGGKDYEYKADSILELMDYFIMTTYNSFQSLTEEDSIKLFSYLDDNIAWYSNYQSYDSFLTNIDGIRVEYDGDGDLNTLREYWFKIKDKLFNIIKMSKSGNITGGLFNFNSSENKFEIVNANISDLYSITNVSFIKCKINNVTAYNCEFCDSEVINGHIWDSNIKGTKMNMCKLTSCIISEWSEINDCLFDGKEITESKMIGGVFRSGTIGLDVEITSSVKMQNKDSFWNIYNPYSKKILPFKKP
jgi:hypothetical protein